MAEISLLDRLPVSGLSRDSAGNVIGIARCARTGLQTYAGYEVDRPDLASVVIFRPEAEVFHRDSMRTYAGVPVTLDHSGTHITPENWRDNAVGETSSDDIIRDGETVKVPFMIRDAGGQKAIEDGKHEVSMGYRSLIDFTPGVVPAGHPDEGKAYDAVQRNIRINHLSIVDKARGGPELRIGDSEQDRSKTMATKHILVDGLQVEVTDAAEAAINKLTGIIAAHVATIGDRDTALADMTKERDELTGKVTALEATVKDATNPENLAKAAAARSTLVDTAKRIVPAIVVDGKTDAEIRRAVVDAKLGEAGKALNDDQAVGAFASLAASAPKSGSTMTDRDVASIIGEGGQTTLDGLTDSRDKAKQARLDRFSRTQTKDEK